MWELAAQDTARQRRVELLEAQRNRQRALQVRAWAPSERCS